MSDEKDVIIVTTKEEIGKAIHNNKDVIIIEGKSAKSTWKIMATGKVAWGVCIASLAVSITAIILLFIPDPGEPVEALIAGSSLVVSNAIIGSAAASTAVSIGIAGAISAGASGMAMVSAAICILNKLRRYKVIERSKNRLVIKNMRRSKNVSK